MKIIEFWIHYGEEFGDDLHFMQGNEWRKVHKLAKECKQGMHPDIVAIERTVGYWSVCELEGSDLIDREYESLYDREEEQ